MEVSDAYGYSVCGIDSWFMNCESGWVWLIAANFLQEVKGLEKQKEEAKDDKQKKDIEGKLSLKTLERDLALAKHV